MTALAIKYSEWCPNCGKGTNQLNDYTGWCKDCSSSDPYIQLEAYLSKNADHLEHYISKGFTVFQAVHAIRDDYRPSCLICGGLISHAPKVSIFCSKHVRCRKARNRYKYLHRKGMNRGTALAKVLEEFN